LASLTSLIAWKNHLTATATRCAEASATTLLLSTLLTSLETALTLRVTHLLSTAPSTLATALSTAGSRGSTCLLSNHQPPP